jgi:hypothetical protein
VPRPRNLIRGPVADLFSAYIAASALSAAHELGLLERLAATGTAAYDGDDDRLDDRLDGRVVRALYAALGWAEVVAIEDGGHTGPRFRRRMRPRLLLLAGPWLR